MMLATFEVGKTYRYRPNGEQFTVLWAGKASDQQPIGARYRDGSEAAWTAILINYEEVPPDQVFYVNMYGPAAGTLRASIEAAHRMRSNGWRQLIEVNVTQGTCRVLEVKS
jgi:hypothetical protein